VLRTSIAKITILALLAPTAASAQAPGKPDPDSRELNLIAYSELLRSDVRTRKVAIITLLMGFTGPRTPLSGPSIASTTPS
jgi:hypothetical protein